MRFVKFIASTAHQIWVRKHFLFIYNMRLRPKYGRYLSQFQNFRPWFRTTFVYWLFLKVGIHDWTSRGDISRGVWDMSLVEIPRVTCRRDTSLVDVTRGHAIRGVHIAVSGKLAWQTTSNCWKKMSSFREKMLLVLYMTRFIRCSHEGISLGDIMLSLHTIYSLFQ